MASGGVGSDDGEKQRKGSAGEKGKKEEKEKKKKKRSPRRKGKFRREKGFLHFLAHNPHDLQTKRLLKYFILPSQYAVLRELVVNDLARNLPAGGKRGKDREGLKVKFKHRLQKLARGQLHQDHLRRLLPYLRALAEDAIRYGLCG